jgi:hypothetical protein
MCYVTNTVYVSAAELHALYNRHFATAIDADQYERVLLDQSLPQKESASEPEGTRSQIWGYRFRNGCGGTGRCMEVIAHCYRRPDNSIGGRGREDPKVVIVNHISHELSLDPDPETGRQRDDH